MKNIYTLLTAVATSLATGITGFSQNMAVAPGTTVTANGGMLAVKSDITNDGLFINTGNSFFFTGASQYLKGTHPVAFEDVTIPAGTSLTALTAGQTIEGRLLVDGTLDPDGNITLVSDAEATAWIDGGGTGEITGSMTMQKYFSSAFGYEYLSSPFNSSTVAQLGDEVNLGASFPPVYRYEENRTASGWVNHSNPAGQLEIMRGYSVNLGSASQPLTADLEGVPNNGKISLALYNNNQSYTKGFNLAGNPYPSPIDWDFEEGWTKTNIDDAIFYFIPGTTSQYSGTYSSYQNLVSSDGIASNIIPAMQGFFVHVSNGSYPVAASLEVNNKARATTGSKSSASSETKALKPLVRLTAGYSDNVNSFDPFVIYYDEKATTAFDGQLDALKLFNTDPAVTNFYVFANDGNKLSINALPFTFDTLCTVRLGLKTSRSGELVFRIRDITGFYADKLISITDAITGESMILRSDNDFRVNLATGDYQNRFFLNIYTIATGTEDKTNMDEEWFKTYTFAGILKTETRLNQGREGILSIVNLNGQVMFNAVVSETGYNEFYPNLADGIYVVTMTSGTTRQSKKILFRK